MDKSNALQVQRKLVSNKLFVRFETYITLLNSPTFLLSQMLYLRGLNDIKHAKCLAHIAWHITCSMIFEGTLIIISNVKYWDTCDKYKATNALLFLPKATESSCS